MVALVDRASSSAAVGGDRERDLDDAAARARASTSKPACSKTREHRPVVGHAPRRRSARSPCAAASAASRSSRRVPIAAALELVGDGERGLGRVRVAQPHVARERDDPLAAVVAERADERAALGPVRLEERLDKRGPSCRRRGSAGSGCARRGRAKNAAARRRPPVVGGPEPQRRAVAEDDVLAVGGSAVMRRSAGPAGWRRPRFPAASSRLRRRRPRAARAFPARPARRASWPRRARP